MSKDFYTAIKDRRSFYQISNEAVVSEERIEEVINYAVKYSPYAFNSQSGRVVVLFGDHHHALWDITKETLRKVVPADNFSSTEEKIASFASGYGTVLFFEDQKIVEGLQKDMELYADKFPIWSDQASGILQFVVWTTLEIEGLGASLQHYNPLIDEEVKKKWDIPTNWELKAQMPFGKPAADAGEKDFQPLEERVKFFK